ncbi:MAG: hypothetical protein EHM34_05185 [Nitrosopumilales archaeon]|nr:MAG: hypothetical protein EHM34_05185 [Nitrosopumilales archaeon]
MVSNNHQIIFGGESKFNESDFIIKDFGIGNDGNPFLAVEGTAGGTIPQKENSGYAYVFVISNGTFSVSSDWMYPQWHTHELTLDEKNCVTSMKMDGGGAEVEDVVKLTETNATDIQRVMTVEFTLSSQDGSFCVTKIFDSIPKA